MSLFIQLRYALPGLKGWSNFLNIHYVRGVLQVKELNYCTDGETDALEYYGWDFEV